MTIRVLAPSLLLLAAGAAGAADNATLNDLRLEGGYSPTTYKVENGGDNKLDSAWRFGVQYVRSFGETADVGSWFWGIEGSDTVGNGKDAADSDINVLVGDLHLGWAFTFPGEARALHGEIGAYGGLGRGTMKPTGISSESAFYWEAGARGALVYTFASMWQLGVDLRYVHGEFKPDFGGPGGSVKVKDDGLIAMLLVGWRF